MHSRLWIIVALLTLGAISPAFGAGGDILWQQVDSLAGKQEAKAMVTDAQGNVIVTGYQNLAGGANDDYATVKFKGDGSGVAWRVFFDKVGGSDVATAVAVDANNDVIITGYVWNGTSKDIHTIKYSGATGAIIWQHTYNGTSNGNDIGTAVAVDSLNNIYVGGYSQNGAGNDDYIVLKYSPSGPNPDGTPLWKATYAGPAAGNDQLSSISTGIDGIAATGQSWNGGSFDMLTVKYDYTGTKLWEKRYVSSGGAAGKVTKVDPGGNVVVTGYAANGTDKDIYTVKYNGATGVVIWAKTFNGGFDDEANGLYVDVVGDVFITGYTWTLAGNENFYTARYSGASGNLVWQQTFDTGSTTNVATSIIVDEAADLFVTGYTVSATGNYDIQTIKYKRDNGNQLWQLRFNGTANLNERPVGIGLSSSGEVLVAGWTDTGTNGLDNLVLKYDPGLLNAPTNLAATTLSATSIKLTWSVNSTNEDGFKIERKLGEFGTYSQIATVGKGVATYTDPGLTANNYYYYRVKAYNTSNGDSHYSNEAHALTVFINYFPPTWTYLYDSPDNSDDEAIAIAVGPDNNPVVTGFSQRTIGGFDYYTAKINRANGNELWSDLYDDPDSEMDKAICLAVDNNSNAIVSGFASLYFEPAAKNINSIYTIKYPAAGPPELWHAQYNGPGAIDDRATAIATAVDASNNVVVTGFGKNAANNDDIYVVKYAAVGTKAWAATPFNGGGEDIPNAVAVAPDGSVYVSGYSEKAPNSGSYNFYTAKYNGSTGALIWSDTFSATAGGDSKAYGLAIDAAGDVYVTGYATNVSGSRDIYTLKYNGAAATAQRVWTRSTSGPGPVGAPFDITLGAAVKVDPIDGGIVVAATTLTGPNDHDVTVIRYNASGDVVWQRTLLRPTNDDAVIAMAMDASGYLYVAGNTSNGTSMDILSAIYDFEGNFLGATVYNGAANTFDEASSIAVNFKGEAFIAGYSTNASGNNDYVVLNQTNSYILVPAPFIATPQADYSKITLTWSNNTASTSLSLERTLAPVTAGSSWTLLTTAVPGTTSYQDTGLNGNTSYCYRITACNGSLCSRQLIACATTTLAPPALNPVSILSTTAIDVSWTNLSGNSGYKLERMASGGSWGQVGGNLAANTTIYHDTGLTAGTVYYYRLSAFNSGGTSLTSAIQPAPVLNALTGVTNAKIDLSWPAVSGITAYKLERSLDNATWTTAATPASSATSYSDTGLASGTTYYYRLKAVTSAGDSGASLVQSAKTKLNAPTLSPPSASSTTQIALVWTDPNGGATVNETGVTVEHSFCIYDNPASCADVTYDPYWSGWTSVSLAANTTSTTIGSLATGRTYRFRVTATLSGANSDPSANQGATTNLTAPTNLAATALSNTTIRLTWTDQIGETNYQVEKDGTILSGVTLALNTALYDVTGLSAGTNYCFRVKPYNAYNYAFSNQACAKTPVPPPTLNSATVVSQTQVDLVWTEVGGETNYELYRTTYNNQWNPGAGWQAYTLINSPAAGVTTYSDQGLSAGYTYKYQIRYKLPDGSFSAYSVEKQVVTVPPTPTNLTAAANIATQVSLNWSDGLGESNYNVQFKSRATANCATEDWSSTASNYAFQDRPYYTANITAGLPYCFRVQSANAAGASPWTAPVTKLPAPTLNDPTGITQSQISLSWSNVSGNTGYKVEKSTDNVNFTQVGGNLAANTVTFTDTSLPPSQLYYYRVRAMNGAGATDVSAPSNVKSATTLAVPVPTLNQPTAITTSQMTICWNDVAGNAGYKVERSLDNAAWSQIATPAQGTTCYPNTGISAGTLYYYRVSTRNSLGYYSVPSNVVSATTTPIAPTVTVNVTSEASIDLKWQVVLGATNYKVLRSIGSAGPWPQLYNLPIPYSTLYCGYYSLPTIGCPNLIPAYTSYTDAGLTENTQYCYQLKAWNATGGDSAVSTTVCAKTPAVDGPNLTAVAAVNSMMIQLYWTYTPSACSPVPCDTPDGFEVWRQAWNGEWVLWKTIFNAAAFTDRISIEPARTYTYRVRAFKAGDYSSFSNQASATTPAYNQTDNTCPVPVANAPVISSAPVTTAKVGVAYSYSVVATPQQGGALTYLLANSPSGMTISSSGLITWTPATSQNGYRPVTVRVTDVGGRITDQNFTINVSP